MIWQDSTIIFFVITAISIVCFWIRPTWQLTSIFSLIFIFKTFISNLWVVFISFQYSSQLFIAHYLNFCFISSIPILHCSYDWVSLLEKLLDFRVRIFYFIAVIFMIDSILLRLPSHQLISSSLPQTSFVNLLSSVNDSFPFLRFSSYTWLFVAIRSARFLTFITGYDSISLLKKHSKPTTL